METQERLANRLSQQLAHGPFPMEFHFPLGRVDIHVHLRGIDFQEQAADRIAVFHQGRVIAFEQGKVDAAILHGAAVDEDVLLGPAGAGNAGRAQQTPHAQRMRRREGGGRVRAGGFIAGGGQIAGEIHGQKLLFAAGQGPPAFAQGGQAVVLADAGQLPDQARVFDKFHGHFRKGERGQRQVVLDVGGLGFVGAEEFAAGGQVEKQLADFDGRAGGAAAGLDGDDFAAVDQDLGAVGGGAVALARGEGETADAGDAGEGLAAKAQGADGVQILGALNFAGGVAFQAEQGVVPAHAQAVIGHADEAAAAGVDFHGQARGTGVEGILDQFLDDAGGPFHHFARGDLVGDLLRQ